MGPITAAIYALLMIVGYSSQIRTLYRKKTTAGVDAKFFIFGWAAVALRMTTTGFVIKETMNLGAISLLIADAVVFFGLLIIFGQIIYYRYSKKYKKREQKTQKEV
jgi:uncharacterized protein with PQ loop repeat